MAISQISGNAQPETKKLILDMLQSMMRKGRGFADSIGGRLNIMEVSVKNKLQEHGKGVDEGRVICEITAQEDMLNGAGYVHGGCLMYLIDNCALLCLTVLDKDARLGMPGLSLAIDTVFHAPAGEGDRLRILATTIAIGSRIKSARVEIWDLKRSRLVASGVEIKMDAPKPKM